MLAVLQQHFARTICHPTDDTRPSQKSTAIPSTSEKIDKLVHSDLINLPVPDSAAVDKSDNLSGRMFT